jgi:hypothetical protein
MVFPSRRVRANPARSNIATVPLCRKDAEYPFSPPLSPEESDKLLRLPGPLESGAEEE